MKELDYTQLTLYQEDSPASPSPKQESTKEPTMTVTSGLKCLESYEKSGPLGSLVKMCLASYVWHSTRCNLIWKKKVTKSNLCLFQLAVLMPHTKENDASFWPTPSTGAALCAGTGSFNTLKRMAEKGLITEEERRQLSQGNGGKTNPALLEWLMGYEEQFTKLIPTPTATDYKGGITTRYWTPPRSQFVHVEREDRSRIRWSAEKFGGGHSPWENWPDEPDICGIFDGLSAELDEVGGLSREAKTRAKEILRNVWSDIGTEAIQRNSGRLQPFYKSEVLFSFLCEYEERSYQGRSAVESGTVTEEFMRDMWENIETSRSSHRRRYNSQFAREYSDALCFMSRKAPSLLQEEWDISSWQDGLARVKDGVKNRVDRIRCLGNAVVPEMFYPIFMWIKEIEDESRNNSPSTGN